MTLVSVVIPTYNGAHRISKVLDSLEGQTFKDFEVVVVVDGSTDGTRNVIESGSWSYPLRIVEQANKGRAGARNAGAHAAQGETLIFYDDDVTVSSESIELHEKEIRDGIATVGQALESNDANTEFSRYKTEISERWLKHLGQEPIDFDRQELFLMAANMGIRKSDFLKLGGFDERLRDAEDYDLAVRAHAEGFRIRYIPKNIVTHRSFDTFREYISRQRAYRLAHIHLNEIRKNHPEKALYAKYMVEKNFGKSLVYYFVPGWVVRWADVGVFRPIPRRMRFGFYARMIAALAVYFPNRKI